MPYKRTRDIPAAARQGLTKHGQSAFRQAFNAAYQQYAGDEDKAFAVAWSAAKKANGYKPGTGKK